jgi:pyruvate/2-oxoglutarate dehydrogenase complex dihydrolipoamide dehydrogenase (E3) component
MNENAVQVLPDDAHNRTLVANVHPPDWVNPQPADRYNLVVVGAGTAGLVSAAGAAGLGARVALVERHLMGGDCLNVGCVPSKALIRSARAYADIRDAGAYGITLDAQPQVDFARVMGRMRRVRAEISPNDSAARFRELGVDVFLGAGRFTGRNTLEVDGRRLRFAKAVIATGARPAEPDILGLAEVGYLTNETVFSLMELPQRLAVVGSGPLGCELAQAFARFGSRVFLIERVAHIMPKEDRDATAFVQRAFERDGVNVLLGVELLRADRQQEGKRLLVRRDGTQDEVVADEILIAVGRAPNVEGLGLDAAEVAYDSARGIHVDDTLRTANSAIYAAGDICSRFKFTHMSDALARIAIRNALFPGRGKASALTVPWCTYTDPEIGHVGLYEHEARERGIDVRTFVQPLAEVDRAIVDGEDEGLLKVHVRAGSDRMVGATLVARHAGEMLAEITLAMVGRLGLKTIANTIHTYPTQAEAIKKIADAYNRTRLTPRSKKLLRRWMAWQRRR